MSRRAPKVVAGAVTASDFFEDGEALKAKPGSGLRPEDLLRGDPVIEGLKNSQIELHSRHGAYVLILSSDGGPPDAQGKERPLILKFRKGRRVLDLEDTYDKRRAEKIRELSAKGRLGSFGLGREFWDAQEAVEKGKARRLAQAIETLENIDPEALRAVPSEVKEKLVEHLGAEYKLPAREKGKQEPGLQQPEPEELADVL